MPIGGVQNRIWRIPPAVASSLHTGASNLQPTYAAPPSVRIVTQAPICPPIPKTRSTLRLPQSPARTDPFIRLSTRFIPTWGKQRTLMTR